MKRKEEEDKWNSGLRKEKNEEKKNLIAAALSLPPTSTKKYFPRLIIPEFSFFLSPSALREKNLLHTSSVCQKAAVAAASSSFFE